MKLTRDQLKHVAKLSNLPVTEEEEETYSAQLSDILGYIDQLDRVDTKEVEPTFNISMNTNITQEDDPSKSLTQNEALANTPQSKNGFFVTKGVFESE
jgi:aspartyl-tRNA(Asn)/glutamyl-tRNA(Gln) amidotransferase subunit C